MAEFKDVIENIRRMHKACACEAGGCPLYGYQFNCADLVNFEYEIADIERDVMKWAADHPVVYPTWEEWLSDKYNLAYNDDFRLAMSREHIPADIAEKLGVQPK